MLLILLWGKQTIEKALLSPRILWHRHHHLRVRKGGRQFRDNSVLKGKYDQTIEDMMSVSVCVCVCGQYFITAAITTVRER